jgi:hypothetical protein
VIYVVWRDVSSTAPIAAADAAIEEMVARYGEGRRLFYVHRTPDRPGFQRTSGELRRAAIAHFERQEERFIAAALAMEAKGLAGTMSRAITAGVLLVRKSQVRSEPFVDARDGVRWLAELSGDDNPFDADEMINALVAADLCLSS